jgi:hypothetical protein
MTKIGVLGSGQVGEVLANGFIMHGYDVMRGTREPGKMEEWKPPGGAKAQIGTFADTAKFGEIVVLAVRGSAAESVIQLAGLDNLVLSIVQFVPTVVLIVSLPLLADVALSGAVPGANDNASGVATVLRLAERYSGELEPGFGLPPIIGTLAVRTMVEQQFGAMVAEIERRAGSTR